MATVRIKKTKDDVISEGEFPCGPCAADSHTHVAIGYCQFCHHFLCKSCFAYHQNLGKAHVLLDKETMATQHVTPAMNFDPLTEPYQDHKHKTLELYCKGHDEVCCVICVTGRHKNCDYVYIPDYTAQLTQSPVDDCSLVPKLIQALIGQLETMRKESSVQIKDLDKQKREFILAVRKYRREIDSTLDQLEKQVIDGVKQVADINTKEFQENIRKCENSLKILQDSYKRTESVVNCDSVNRQFTLAKMSNKKLQENNAVLKSVRDKSVHIDVKFDENAEILKFVKRMKMFGKVSVKKESLKFESEQEADDSAKVNGDKVNDKIQDAKGKDEKSPRKESP